MKRLFPALIVMVLLVVGVGFYRGWFVISSTQSGSQNDKTNVNLTVDQGKMQQDADAVKDSASGRTGDNDGDRR